MQITIEEVESMSHHFALFSLVFMMAFLMLFDKIHARHLIGRWSINLFSRDELDRIMLIMSACQDG
jgi:hypothetical protein